MVATPSSDLTRIEVRAPEAALQRAAELQPRLKEQSQANQRTE
jgi:hypothetical protein